MPRLDARSETAARRSDQLLSFSPKSANRRLVSTDQLRLPTRRTKLLTPSVAICRCSRSHELQRPRRNLTEQVDSVNSIFFVLKNKFSQFFEEFLRLISLRAPPRGTWVSRERHSVDNATSLPEQIFVARVRTPYFGCDKSCAPLHSSRRREQ